MNPIQNNSGKWRSSLAFGALALTLGGCAQIGKTPSGTSLAQVEQQFGKPTVTCPLPSSGTRAIWSQQPFGEFAWATDVTPDGNIGEMVQVLSDQSFSRLSRGIWKAEDVRCAFGPPADIDQVGTPSVRTTVWSYRYRQDGVWYSLMYIYFPLEGDRVLKYHAGPDPMFSYDGSLSRLR